MSASDTDFDEGFENGKAWADHAEGTEPHENLLSMRKGLKDFEWDALFDEDFPTDSHWEWLAGVMVGNDSDREKLRFFWKWAVGEKLLDRLDSPAFIKGFAEGAIEDFIGLHP